MKVYLLYEFTNRNYDQDILEHAEIIGVYRDIPTTIKKANERVKYGIEECDVIINPDIKNKKNPFEETWCVEMCREGIEDEDEIEYVEIYSIIIEELELE